MKRSLLIISFFASQAILAQPAVKLYAFSQMFTPGMVPSEDAPDENGGKRVKGPRTVTNYYIFIAADTSIKIQAREIWIDGKWDTIASLQTVVTPFISEYPRKTTLVPATKNKVQQVNIGEPLKRTVVQTALLKKMMKENEVIVAYIWKGKKYYLSLKKLTVLEIIHGV
jgi:transcription antitermination factor NusG